MATVIISEILLKTALNTIQSIKQPSVSVIENYDGSVTVENLVSSIVNDSDHRGELSIGHHQIVTVALFCILYRNDLRTAADSFTHNFILNCAIKSTQTFNDPKEEAF